MSALAFEACCWLDLIIRTTSGVAEMLRWTRKYCREWYLISRKHHNAKCMKWYNPIRLGGQMTKFGAAIQKPLTLRYPNFVTFSFYLKTCSEQILTKLVDQGSCCCSFLIEMWQKFWKWKTFLFLKIAEIDMGGGSIFWWKRTNLDIKTHFFKVKSIFRE